MVLMVALDLPGRGIDCDRRGGEEIVARALVAHPRPTIAGAPESQIGRRIVGASDPHRSAAGLPLVAIGPGLAARFAGRRHRISLPYWLARLRVEGCHK